MVSVAEVPELLESWHPDNQRNPKDVSLGSEYRAKWICNKGHQDWVTQVLIRGRGSGCPVCSGQVIQVGYNDLATTHPKLVCELTDKDLAKQVGASSGRKVEWKCGLDHRWLAKISSRTYGQNGCPYCAGRLVWVGFNDLRTTHPEVAKEMVAESNSKTPEELTRGSRYVAQFNCGNGHDNYLMEVRTRTRQSRGCPTCTYRRIEIGINDVKTTHPHLESQWSCKNKKTLKQVHEQSRERFEWVCDKGHQWIAEVRVRCRGTGCPKCPTKMSSGEGEVLAFVRESVNAKVISGDRTRLSRKELDVFIPEMDKAIEYQGTYWHSLERTKQRDREKYEECLKLGIKIHYVHEEEWTKSPDKVKEDLRTFLSQE